MTQPVIGYVHEQCFATDELRASLAALGDLRFVEPAAEALAGVDVVLGFGGRHIGADALAGARSLLAVTHLGTAIHCDLAAATRSGVVVLHNPGANARSVAEHTIGLVLGLSKVIVQSDREMQAGRPFVLGARHLRGAELRGRVLGLVGFGAVAREVARIAANGFDMDVLVWSRRPGDAEAEGYVSVALDDLLIESDVVSVHLGIGPETRGVVDARRIALLKPTAIFVNTARAEIVDYGALATAARGGRIAGAAIDTWPDDTPDFASPLFGLDNVIVTAHNAGLSKEASTRMTEAVIDGVTSVLAGTRPTLARVANEEVWSRRRRRHDPGA